MKIGSKAGPLIVSPTIPNVVTPTLCATKLKSLSDVYTPGETKTLFDVAITLFSYCLNLFYCINIHQKHKNFTSMYVFINWADYFLPFFYLMEKPRKKIKNLKISVETHDVLKRYCDKRGLKIYKFLETLILEKCKEKRDLYGEN